MPDGAVASYSDGASRVGRARRQRDGGRSSCALRQDAVQRASTSVGSAFCGGGRRCVAASALSSNRRASRLGSGAAVVAAPDRESALRRCSASACSWEAQAISLLPSGFEALEADEFGQVEERARHGGNRDPSTHRSILRMEAPTMNPRSVAPATNALATGRCGRRRRRGAHGLEMPQSAAALRWLSSAPSP